MVIALDGDDSQKAVDTQPLAVVRRSVRRPLSALANILQAHGNIRHRYILFYKQQEVIFIHQVASRLSAFPQNNSVDELVDCVSDRCRRQLIHSFSVRYHFTHFAKVQLEFLFNQLRRYGASTSNVGSIAARHYTAAQRRR